MRKKIEDEEEDEEKEEKCRKLEIRNKGKNYEGKIIREEGRRDRRRNLTSMQILPRA